MRGALRRFAPLQRCVYVTIATPAGNNQLQFVTTLTQLPNIKPAVEPSNETQTGQLPHYGQCGFTQEQNLPKAVSGLTQACGLSSGGEHGSGLYSGHITLHNGFCSNATVRHALQACDVGSATVADHLHKAQRMNSYQ